MHYISVTWKLICAIIPPAGWKGSYPTFVGSLVILVGIIFLTKEVRVCVCALRVCVCVCALRVCVCVCVCARVLRVCVPMLMHNLLFFVNAHTVTLCNAACAHLARLDCPRQSHAYGVIL